MAYKNIGVIMNDLKINIWNHVHAQIFNIVNNFPNHFRYNNDSEVKFLQNFERYYNCIKAKIMYDSVQELDRHKLAAIIICSIIKADPLQSIYPYKEKEYIFDGNEKIAIDIGLSYMSASLKKLLSLRPEEEKKFEDFIFPKASMCDTDYISILCRNLCYAKKYYELNPIDLANTLFLLEYITLLQIDIAPETMKQLCDEIANRKR